MVFFRLLFIFLFMYSFFAFYFTGIEKIFEKKPHIMEEGVYLANIYRHSLINYPSIHLKGVF